MHRITPLILSAIILVSIISPIALAYVDPTKAVEPKSEEIKKGMKPYKEFIPQGIVRITNRTIQQAIKPIQPYIEVYKIDVNMFDLDYVKKLFGDEVRVFIKYVEGYENVVEAKVAELGGKVVYRYPMIDTILVAIPFNKYTEFLKALKDYVKSGFADAATLDYPRYPLLDISVPLTGAPTTWNLGYNGSGVTVAVLDTGIDPSHPDFYFPNGTSKIVANASFVDYDNDGIIDENVTDTHGHGTHVASIIAGTGLAELFAHSGEYVWHTSTRWMPFGYALGNPNGWENVLIYWFNVTGYDNITFSFWDKLHINPLWYYWYGYDDEAYVLYSYDGVNWEVLDVFNVTTRNTTDTSWMYHEYIIDTTNKTDLYIAFVYVAYIAIAQYGWWIDDISVVELNFTDDLESGLPLITSVGGAVYYDQGWYVVRGRFIGMAPGAKLMIGKVCSAIYGYCASSWIMNGMIWAAMNGADIISMSLGGPAYPGYYDPEAELVDYLTQTYNVTFVIAAGNSGDYGPYTVESPGIARSAITVAAAQKPVDNLEADIIYFSSRGPSIVDFTVKPDVAAPGVNIIAARSQYAYYDPNWDLQYYTSMSGTSAATPYVSGAAAIIKSAHPDWTPAMIKSALMSTATILNYRRYSSWYPPTPATVYEQGAGFINVAAAVNAKALPIPASLSYQIVDKGTSKTLSFIVKIVDPAYANATLSIVNETVRLIEYSQYDDDYYVSNVSPYTGWLSFNITQLNSTAYNVSVTLTVPANATGGIYDGIIWLNLSGYIFHVILGFIASPVTIYGYAYDVVTSNGLANITVYVVNEAYSIIAWNTTNASGYFELEVPVNESIFLYAFDDNNAYYVYYGRFFTVLPPYQRHDIYMTPRWGYADRHVLVVVDDYYGGYYGPDPTIFTKFNGTYGLVFRIWRESLQGIPIDPIYRSYDYPYVIWTSATAWYAVVPPDDYILEVFVNNKGRLLIDGEDIGWFHEYVLADDFLENVLHATWLADDSGIYTITLVAPNHLLGKGIPTTVDIGYPPWPDAIAPYNGSIAVYNYTDSNMSAIIAYDGILRGEGRLIYVSFPLMDLNSAYLDQFVQNCLEWLLVLDPWYTALTVTVNQPNGTIYGNSSISGVVVSNMDGRISILLEIYDNLGLASSTETTLYVVADTSVPTKLVIQHPWWINGNVETIVKVYYNGYLVSVLPLPT